MTHDACRALLARHFTEGDLAGLEQQALRSHLRGCAECRADFDARVDAEAALGPHAQATRMAAEAAHWRPPARPALRRWMGVAGAVVAAAGVAVVVVRDHRDVGADEALRARGTEGAAPPTAFVTLHRQDAEGTGPLTDAMRATDAVLVAYTNGRDSTAAYLAVAGRDARGAVHWFYPAWREAAESPRSVPIDRGVADRELPDAVSVSPAPGRMEVCALFTDRPLDVKSVDAELTRGREWPAAEAIDCHLVEVLP